MIQLTRWIRRTAKANTSYGMISHEEWCKLEAKRLGDHAKIVENPLHSSEIAIFIGDSQ